MKVLYIHGYGGSANGKTSQMLAKCFPNDTIFAPAIPYKDPEKSLKAIADYVVSFDPDVIMGCSLGAYYVLQINVGVPRLVVNPALPKDLVKIDNTPKFIESLEAQLANIEKDTLDMVYIFCGDNDTVAPNGKYFAKKYAGNAAYVVEHGDMGHELTKECAKNEINSMLNRIEFGNKLVGNEKERKSWAK